jgi:tetratricopeptide (TPR) repeat protein
MSSLNSFYVERQVEIDLLGDTEGLFVLGFIDRSAIASINNLQSELLWKPELVQEVVHRLVTNGALLAAGEGGKLSLTPSGLQAIESFNRISSRQEGDARQSQALAQELFRSGVALSQSPRSVDKAVEADTRAIELDPDLPGALLNLGSILLSRAKYEPAEKYYRRALEAKPDYAKAHFNLGLLYHEREHATLAEMHYKTAIVLDPQYGDAYYNLAVLLEEHRRHSAAIPYWRTFLKFDSESKWADIARNRLYAARLPVAARYSPAPELIEAHEQEVI